MDIEMSIAQRLCCHPSPAVRCAVARLVGVCHLALTSLPTEISFPAKDGAPGWEKAVRLGQGDGSGTLRWR